MKQLLAAAIFALSSTAALADIEVHEPYIVNSPGMPSAAALMHLMNTGEADDRLIEARSDIAARVELHTHIEEDGVMKMREVEGGFTIPAGGHHVLERGADHIMFMGLTGRLTDGDIVSITLVFEQAGEMIVEIEVDNDFKPMSGENMDHNHDHSHEHQHGEETNGS